MSTTPLSSIQEIIERSLFEAIRQEIVDKGYLPDVSNTVRFPDDQTGWDQWQTDIDDIVTSLGFAVELFSVGSNEAKGVKKVPRIVLEAGNFLPGALGGDPRRYFVDAGSEWNAKITPPQTTDFYINFCVVSNTAAQARVLNAILALSVPRRGYIPWYNDATKSFFARFLNYYDRTDEDEGIIEHVYAYEIPDAWDMDDRDDPNHPTIANIDEITLNINVQKYMDRTWGYDSTPLIVT